MKKLFREIADLLQKKESFVVATIFNQTGSAPRTTGAKMVVRSDGSIIGTIGGGRLEAAAIELAGKVLLSRQTLIQPFDLTGEDAAGLGMICGGQGEVFLDFIDGNDKNNRLIYEEALAILDQRGKAWLITAFGNEQNPGGQTRRQCLVRSDGILIGRFDCDSEFLAKLTSGPAKISIHAEVLDNQRFLVEPIRHPGTVYIFGAGHVSQKIAPLSESVGFKTVVLDDRAEYANRERFPESTKLIVLASFELLPELAIDETSYIVIVTRGHLYDRTILEWSLRTNAGYIGMIGSRKKRDKTFASLAEQGFSNQDFIRVYSPIGTDIGAETPEEIAVSIVGELIKVRAGRENVH